MAGKTRRVVFYQGIETDQDKRATPWSEQRWKRLFEEIRAAEEAEKEEDSGETQPENQPRQLWNEFNGRSYHCSVRTCKSPDVDYLYLCKLRPHIDWPDVLDFHGTVESLVAKAAQMGITNILEPCYILPVSGTNYIAVMRSSGGPSPKAISDWIDSFIDDVKSDEVFEVVPVFTKDALKRLSTAQGARRLSFAFRQAPVESHDDKKTESHVEKAVSELSKIATQEMSIGVTLSFGPARQLGPGTDEMLKEVNEIVRKDMRSNRKLSKLEATVIQDGDDGQKSDPIDFLKEQCYERVEVGDNEDDEPTPETILKAMWSAIGEFKKKLRT